MFEYDDYEEEIDVKNIKHLYELRHSCNVFGSDYVSKELNISNDKILNLYYSKIHGSTKLKEFFSVSDQEFQNMIDKYEQEIIDVENKNLQLIEDLKESRKLFAGIGTNKAKRRLNKLAKNNPIAKAVRLAIEIEDKSISAKNSYGDYKEKIYNQKYNYIIKLCELFEQQKWIYGIQNSDIKMISHVIYFEIPDREQISWHITLKEFSKFPIYKKDWDNKKNSTIKKLEDITIKLLESK